MTMDDLKELVRNGASVAEGLEAYNGWLNERRDGSPETLGDLVNATSSFISWLDQEAIRHRSSAGEMEDSEAAAAARAYATRLSDLREAIRAAY